MLGVTVQGGTNAGRRIAREAHRPWFCNCETDDGMKLNPGWRRACDDCRDTRDGQAPTTT